MQPLVSRRRPHGGQGPRPGALRVPGAHVVPRNGLQVASALLGTILGSIVAGPPAERHGRRPMFLAVALLYVVSAVGCGLAWSWPSLLIFRFIGGIGVGAASVVAPMYIAEISPAHVRGRLVAISQFNVVAGILAAAGCQDPSPPPRLPADARYTLST